MDHIFVGGGAMGEFSEPLHKLNINGPNRPSGMYVARFQNLPGRPTVEEIPARLRLRRQRQLEFQLVRNRLWRGI